ncbi:MAG TPA: helix-turn-helix domain-containing protein [Solirubrobacteraceae bacterium]|nr:helix-turn-helix domain-containing protein [Solirubrobacteraceae bacterium]
MTATGTALSSRPAAGGDRAALLRQNLAERRVGGLLGELRVTQAAMLQAVVAGAGLGRLAQLAADAVRGPVAIVIPRVGSAIAPERAHAGADLTALTAWVSERARGRPAAVPVGVLAEAPVVFGEEVVGIVALLRGGQPPRAEALEFLHAVATAALVGLAVEDAREETEQLLRGSFLEELRSREQLSGAEIVRRAARLGCDLSDGGLILCAALTSNRSQLVTATIAAEHPGAIAQQLDGAGGEVQARIYAALPVGVGDGTPAAALASGRALVERLRRHAIVGLSSVHADPGELGAAVQEAELMLEVLQQSGAPIADEIGTGTYKLLFRMLASHPEEVRSFYEATVAALVRYDKRYRTELVHTLQAYLDADCNMNATASAIFAHRHTVAYRLERIRDLAGLDPMRSEDRERLGLGLKVHRIMAPRLLAAT